MNGIKLAFHTINEQVDEIQSLRAKLHNARAASAAWKRAAKKWSRAREQTVELYATAADEHDEAREMYKALSKDILATYYQTCPKNWAYSDPHQALSNIVRFMKGGRDEAQAQATRWFQRIQVLDEEYAAARARVAQLEAQRDADVDVRGGAVKRAQEYDAELREARAFINTQRARILQYESDWHMMLREIAELNDAMALDDGDWVDADDDQLLEQFDPWHVIRHACAQLETDAT